MKTRSTLGRFRAALLNWAGGGAFSLRDGEAMASISGRATATGKHVSVDSALQLSTVLGVRQADLRDGIHLADARLPQAGQRRPRRR